MDIHKWAKKNSLWAKELFSNKLKFKYKIVQQKTNLNPSSRLILNLGPGA